MINEPHKVLGVSENATQDEIKKAYRKMAKKYHPDLNPGDEVAAQKMNEVNEAYDMLMNPEKYRRQTTNSYGGYGQSSYGGYGNQQGQTYRTYTYGGPFGGWTYTNVDFDDFFGGSSTKQNANSNADFMNPQVDVNDTYDFRKAIGEINSKKFNDALNTLMRVPSFARKARWYYLCALANYGLGNSVQAAADIQKAVNEEPDNMTYRRAYQGINHSSQTYQRNATTYQRGFGGVGSLCCSMALSQMLCGNPCFFCFC